MPSLVTCNNVPNIAVFENAGKARVQLPTRPLLSTDGQSLLRDRKGRVRHITIIGWTDPMLGARFADEVIGLIEREYPGSIYGDKPDEDGGVEAELFEEGA